MNNSNEATVGFMSSVVTPRDDIFLEREAHQNALLGPGLRFHIFERVEYPESGGIFVYYRGLKYPKKGFPFPEAVASVNILKRNIRYLLMVFSSKGALLPLFAFALQPWKVKTQTIIRILSELNRISQSIIQPYVLQENRYSVPVNEYGKFVHAFLRSIGCGYEAEMAQIAKTLIEYDDAYRYRIEDMITEASKEMLLKNPRKEVTRLIGEYLKREKAAQVIDMAKAARLLASVIFLHPRIKKAFRSGIEAMDFQKAGLDEADSYHVLNWSDYDFWGKSFDTRSRLFVEAHTKSKCCGAQVYESRRGFQQCLKCGNKCEFIQDFPPVVEVAQQ